MPEEVASNTPVAPAQSFAERKTAQLSEERHLRGETQPVAPEALPLETPQGELQESVDVGSDDPVVYASEDDDFDGENPPEALDNETPEGQATEEVESNTDWEKRYSDLQSETQGIRDSRGEMDQEHAQSMSQHLQVRYELEDKLTEAVSRAEWMKNAMEGNAQQFRNIDWSRVPPDKVQEVQAQAQQAFMLQQQSQQAFEQMSEETGKTKELVKQREADIAKVRLRRTIPNWSNETYAGLRDFAMEQGLPAAEFNNITNPVIIEALYTAQQIKTTGSNVQTSTTRKAQAPRGKAARRQSRNTRGQFENKVVEPNQRGSFADKHRHRLAMERTGQ
jgi:hypothetical protein